MTSAFKYQLDTLFTSYSPDVQLNVCMERYLAHIEPDDKEKLLRHEKSICLMIVESSNTDKNMYAFCRPVNKMNADNKKEADRILQEAPYGVVTGEIAHAKSKCLFLSDLEKTHCVLY